MRHILEKKPFPAKYFLFCRLKKNGVALLFLLFVQILAFVLIQSRGNFPINDDWAYAHSTQWLLSEGRIRLSDWVAMNLLPQTIIGAIVTKIFGFSFDVLRQTTQTISLLTSVFMFSWFRTLHFDVRTALFGSLLMVAMPWWMVLANSYMTEFYMLVLVLPGVALYTSLLDRERTFSTWKWGLATILMVAAVLQRQTALVFPLAFCIAYFFRVPKVGFKSLVVMIAPVLLVFAAELLYRNYLQIGPGIPSAQQYAHSRVWPLLQSLLKGTPPYPQWLWIQVAHISGYIGLGCALWGMWCFSQNSEKRKNEFLITALSIMLLVVFAWQQWWPPYRENQVLVSSGIGPYTLHGVFTKAVHGFDRPPAVFWYGAGALACWGMAFFIDALARATKKIFCDKRNADPIIVFLMIIIAGYILPFVITDFFDRYIFFIFPIIFVLAARVNQNRNELNKGDILARTSRALSYVALAGLLTTMILSTMATHDYFSWQRARWAAISQAEKYGGSPKNIDGGFEYNGFYNFEERKHQSTTAGKSWWWVDDDKFIITFGTVPGYDVIETFPVPQWLVSTPQTVLLLRRKEGPYP